MHLENSRYHCAATRTLHSFYIHNLVLRRAKLVTAIVQWQGFACPSGGFACLLRSDVNFQTVLLVDTMTTVVLVSKVSLLAFKIL